MLLSPRGCQINFGISSVYLQNCLWKTNVLKLMFLSRLSSIFGYQLKVVYCVGRYECQISTTPHLSRIISLVVKGDRQGGRAPHNRHTTHCRARHPAAGRTRDVPRHRQRPRQPHLRHRDPHLSRGRGMVPQQHSGQVYCGSSKATIYFYVSAWNDHRTGHLYFNLVSVHVIILMIRWGL